jgi:TetR/AcrR family transcriptional regulator, transcriptional repressor for nem operon
MNFEMDTKERIVVDNIADDWANGFVADAFDEDLPPMEHLDYMVDAVYYWQKAAKNLEGHMPGCLFGNLALEQAIERGDIPSLDTKATTTAMHAYLEGVILLAETRTDPDVVRNLGPAIKIIRIERKH